MPSSKNDVPPQDSRRLKITAPFKIGVVMADVEAVPPFYPDPAGNFVEFLQYDDVLAYRPKPS